MTHPRMVTRRRWWGKFRQYRCALCYGYLWPWQARARGANYFLHPYMSVHQQCGNRYVELRKVAPREQANGPGS